MSALTDTEGLRRMLRQTKLQVNVLKTCVCLNVSHCTVPFVPCNP